MMKGELLKILRWSFYLTLLVVMGCSSPPNVDDPLRVVHLTDPHIPSQYEDGDKRIENLKIAVDEIAALSPEPDFIVMTGDIAAHSGEEGSYLLFSTIIDKLSPPIYYALGNHDSRIPFKKILLNDKSPNDERLYYSFKRGRYLFIVLDSLKLGSVEGVLGKKQLRWLKNELDENREYKTAIFLHHHSISVGVADEYMLSDSKGFLALLSKHPQVIFVANGHTHLGKVIEKNGIQFINTMATSYGHTEAAGEPGYRIIELYSDGRMKTVDKRLR